MKDFFISYNSKDRQWAEWIAWVLEEEGYSVVIQVWDFPPGGNFVLEMQKATSAAQQTIAVISENYLEANYTQSEWAAAFSVDPEGEKRKLIPVRIQPCKPKGLLKSIIRIDLVGLSEDEARMTLLAGFRDRAKPPQKPMFPGSTRQEFKHVEFPGTAENLVVSVDRGSPSKTTDEPPPPSNIWRRQALKVLFLGGTGSIVLATGSRIWDSFKPLPPASEAYFIFDVVKLNAEGKKMEEQPGSIEGLVQQLHNGVILEMVSIPGGTFMMGSPETENKRNENESPQHEVTIGPFMLGRYPVTQEQYTAVTKKNPPPYREKNLPVEKACWYDALEFCALLSNATGRDYRLPSEAEWEYACRAGTTTPFHFGETITKKFANYNSNFTFGNVPTEDSLNKTITEIKKVEATPVGMFGKSNAFGLYDMHGNVFEWCAERGYEKYAGSPPVETLCQKKIEEEYPVIRGGGYNSPPKDCRSAYRRKMNPCTRYGSPFGFRVACSLS